MANDFTSVPLKIDTAMPNTFRNSSLSWTPSSIYPTRIYWENPINVGDIFTIYNPAGTLLLWTGRCEVVDQSQWFNVPFGTRWIDWQCTTISSGTLYIYFLT